MPVIPVIGRHPKTLNENGHSPESRCLRWHGDDRPATLAVSALIELPRRYRRRQPIAELEEDAQFIGLAINLVTLDDERPPDAPNEADRRLSRQRSLPRSVKRLEHVERVDDRLCRTFSCFPLFPPLKKGAA
jgi:hypothetical protein